MHSKTFTLLLISIILLRFCVCTESGTLDELNSALIETVRAAKKKHKIDMVCYQDIDCFHRMGPFKHLGLLPKSPEQIKTRFFVYNKQTKAGLELHPNVSQSLSVVVRNQTLVILIHGFVDDSKKPELIALKDSLLEYANMPNVLMVDWSKGSAAPWYAHAAVNTELVGRQIAFLVNELNKHRNINPNFIHLIGFSLGAHVAHFAGQHLSIKYKHKFGRITGLDAAAPLFQGYSGTHLTKSDAYFVDAIHTSGGKYIALGQVGFTLPLGHIDFYPNNGVKQPRCESASLFDQACDHNTAIHYMEASLRARSICSMMAFKCESWNQFSSGNYTEETGKAIMGYFSVLSKSRGNHYLKTSDKFPFCLNNNIIKNSKTRRKTKRAG